MPLPLYTVSLCLKEAEQKFHHNSFMLQQLSLSLSLNHNHICLTAFIWRHIQAHAQLKHNRTCTVLFTLRGIVWIRQKMTAKFHSFKITKYLLSDLCGKGQRNAKNEFDTG